MYSRPSPPRWLMVILMGCLCVLLVFSLTRPDLAGQSAQAMEEALVVESTPSPVPTPSPTPAPTPTPTPTPEPTSEPTPEPDWSQPVPLGEAVDQEEWFSDAVFIGDSRTDGLKLFSGITSEAAFLDYTGLTTTHVVNGAQVIRSGEAKISIMDALAQESYGKVYISLGLNELGNYSPQGYGEAYRQILDDVRERQPEAEVYVQLIFPVNETKCKENDIAYYINNDLVAQYNEVLPAICQEKKVRLIDIPDGLQDEDGTSPYDITVDGVHYQKNYYKLWLDYLTTHTGQ